MKLPIKLNFQDATGKTFEFDKLETFLDFIKVEQRFWAEKASELLQTKGFTNPYLNIEAIFQLILNTTKTWKKDSKNLEESVFSTQVQSLNTSQLSIIHTKWIWSGQPFIPAWLNAYKVSQAAGEGFIQATLTRTIPNFSNYDWLKGYLLAYEFELQGESFITKRRDSEAQAFEHLRGVLVEQKDNLVSEISDFETNADNVTKTYVEHMRLEGPAKYWKDRAEECKEQGEYWARLLGATITSAVIIFVFLMAAWLHAYSTKINLNTLEGAVIFAATISVFAFAIKTLSKLTFSAFHLQRDAEEREQLTHLYLALSNDNKVDAESRNIVLQALFSRSDSGLLAGDHSPAMPSIQDAIKAAGK
ncbi:MAG TPA: DUF6161 domain-containing protein [Methylotenera sp.]|nr:DUF6161 domain-containing protein [Methylotenera sp.]HPV45388.1 DUF6161 domain-containing protein [Methylotenera sp.]